MILWNTSISNYLLSIENFQIYKSFIDRKSNAWFTLSSENETMVCDTKIFFRSTSGHGLKSLNDRHSDTFEKNRSCSNYHMSSKKYKAIRKSFTNLYRFQFEHLVYPGFRVILTLRSFLGRLPVTVFKRLNDRQFDTNLRN